LDGGLGGRASPREEGDPSLPGEPERPSLGKPPRPVTAVVIGTGGRGNVYAAYALSHPDEWRIVGVAEPLRDRNEAMARAQGIPDANRFAAWQHVFDRPKFADVCVVTTPDHLPRGPALQRYCTKVASPCQRMTSSVPATMAPVTWRPRSSAPSLGLNPM